MGGEAPYPGGVRRKRDALSALRVRRPPPPFRAVAVQRVEAMTPRMTRVTLAGEQLRGFGVEEPAASVRLLLPFPGESELVVPEWNGNEFLLPDGSRPVIRTFTPRRADPEAGELALDIVVHGGGAASEWAVAASPGDPAGVSGPGRGYAIDPEAPGYLLAGDETALPAVAQLLEAIPAGIPVEAHIEVARPEAEQRLPDHPSATAVWHRLPEGAPSGDAMVAAVTAAVFGSATRVWAAGEAAAVQRIRRHLREERDHPRELATIRGYWKQGRRGA